jgi:hypothetical protein
MSTNVHYISSQDSQVGELTMLVGAEHEGEYDFTVASLIRRRDAKPPIHQDGQASLFAGTHTSRPSTDYFVLFPTKDVLEQYLAKVQDSYPELRTIAQFSDSKGFTLYFEIKS